MNINSLKKNLLTEILETFRHYNHDNTVQKLLTYNFSFKLQDVYCYEKPDKKKDKQ